MLVASRCDLITFGLIQDHIWCLGPDERVCPLVPAVDELSDLVHQVTHQSEHATTDGPTFDDAELDLDQVQPGPRGRGEGHADRRVGRQLVLDRLALVGGIVVSGGKLFQRRATRLLGLRTILLCRGSLIYPKRCVIFSHQELSMDGVLQRRMLPDHAEVLQDTLQTIDWQLSNLDSIPTAVRRGVRL